MKQIIVILDLISGLLVAVDFLFPQTLGDRIGILFLKWIPNKKEIKKPLQPKTIRFNIAVTLFVFFLCLLWSMAKANGPFTTVGVLTTTAFFGIGAVAGAIVMTGVELVIGDSVKETHELYNVLIMVSFVLTILGLLLFNTILRISVWLGIIDFRD